MADKKIIDRILKLFNLGNHQATGGQTGTTENEMLLAVTKARQLMAEHAISMHDIEAHKGADTAAALDARMRDVPVYSRAGRNLADYDWAVAHAVGDLTDTEVFQRRGWGALGKSSKRPQGGYGQIVSVVFVGDEDDVALAGELFHLWLRDVRKFARAAYGGGNAWNARHTSYAIGMAVRLGERARQMVHLGNTDQQTWGLVLSSKRDAITRWKSNQKFADPDKRRPIKVEGDAYWRGHADGAHVNMNKKILP